MHFALAIFSCTCYRAGGTGLGLFALRKRAEALGGTFGVTNRSNGRRGSIFFFTIPYRPDFTQFTFTQSSSSKSFTADLLIPTQSSKFNITVLLVDDSPIIQKTVSRALTSKGFAVSLANNGFDCLQHLEGKYYDMVLMDSQMPVMDGIECIKRIRQLEASPSSKHYGRHQRIILVSADIDGKTRDEAFSAGVDAFEPKPIRAAKIQWHCINMGLIA
jgi:CheY-like chemotaxis protein